MREIVLDTETTGLDPLAGHRVVEIGCIELINHVPTGKTYHQYINPERDMPDEAYAVHGLSEEHLSQFPVFAAIVEEFMTFIGEDSTIVAHNAEFDINFINAELRRLGFAPLSMSRAVDTVKLARQLMPGAQANLDALCKRFGVDNSNRTLHGALLDAELLAEVYLELSGGRQPDLALSAETAEETAHVQRIQREPRAFAPSEAERRAHEAFLEKLKDPLWKAQ